MERFTASRENKNLLSVTHVVVILQPEHTWPQTSCRFTLIMTEHGHSLCLVVFYFCFWLRSDGISLQAQWKNDCLQFNCNAHSYSQKNLSVKEMLEIPAVTHTHKHTHTHTLKHVTLEEITLTSTHFLKTHLNINHSPQKPAI